MPAAPITLRLTLLLPLLLTLTAAQTPPEFDAATIKPAAAADHPYLLANDGTRLYARAASLRYLITEAWGIQNYQLAGAGNWIDQNLYTINATIPAHPDHTQTMLMLRRLLADRFHLQVHDETRRTKVYALTVAKGGPKLKPLAEGEAPRQPLNPNINSDQVTLQAGTDIPALVRAMNSRGGTDALGWPVVDQTGLTGKFNIWLTYDNKTDPDGRSGTFHIDYLSALPKQLGLRLDITQADCAFLVIDHADKPDLNN